MQKSTIISFLFIVFIIAIFLSCNQKKRSLDEKSEGEPQATSSQGKVSTSDTTLLLYPRDPSADSIHIERTIPIKGDFFQITNISNSLVEYHVGENSIIVEGDSATIETLEFEIDGGILTVSTPMEVNNDLPYTPFRSDIIVHVSCPELLTIANCGGGGFLYHGTLKGDIIQLGGLVAGSIEIDSISCHQFRYDSNGDTSLKIGGIECDEGVVISTGGGSLQLNMTALDRAYFEIGGESNLSASVKSPTLMCLNGSKGRVQYNLSTDKFVLRANHGNIELSGHAKDRDIQIQGNPEIINNLK